MSNYLMREAAPFTSEEWAALDEMAVRVAKNVLVGRKFIEIVGPLGYGVEQAPLFGFDYATSVAKPADYLRLQEYSQDYMLLAKQQAIAQNTPFALDLGAVALAATKLAKAEDKAIIEEGLSKQAKLSGALGDWGVPGMPFGAIARATASLLQAGCDGPYALVLCPERYAQLASLVKDGIREIELVEKLVKGGIFPCTVINCDQVLVLSLANWNFDLVIGQDLVTAYIGNEGMDQKLRIFETLALRVKRPESICVLK